jgi:Ca2+-binding EF-hand superfamily protein
MRSDRDGNKKISRAEAPSWLRRTFDSVDANSDGEIDQKELEQAIAKIRGRR